MAERSYHRREHERAPDRGWRRGRDEERYDHVRGDDGYRRRDHRHAHDDDRYDRDWADKSVDEVKSWFGNERAERRRAVDRAREDRWEQERRDFTGVGPRLRHDEDDDLRDAINRRLAEDPRLDASGIVVRVLDNEAILDGVVASARDARWAHDLALDVPGVVAVRDRMRVDSRALERLHDRERQSRDYDYDERHSRDGRRYRPRWS